MQLIEYLDLFAGALINVMFCAILIRKIFNIKMINNNKLKILILFLVTIFVSIINLYNKNVFKLLLTIPFFTLGMKYIFNISSLKSLLYVLAVTFYMFIGEIIIGVFLALLPLDYAYLLNNVFGKTIGCILVVCATVPLTLNKKINKSIENMITIMEIKKPLIYGILFAIAIGAFAYKNTVATNNLISSLMNGLIFLSFIIIIYLFYKESQKSKQMSNDYNVLITYLGKYEKELVEKRKIIHDYKNQLIVINGYIDNRKKLEAYVKELVNEQKLISENAMISNIDKLPSGLKGLVYYKFSQINENIKININVSQEINKFEMIPSKKNKDILKIIGVLIDNAIEGAMESKEKNIEIEFSILNDEFKMQIINNYDEKTDIDMIMNPGFSTKGKNRGYGLSLVKDILKENKQFDLSISADKQIFKTNFSAKI